MDARLLREFATRPRDEVEAAKIAHWAHAYRELGPATTLAAAHALYAHARAVRPDYPTVSDRAEDLEHHVNLKRLLDRASGALAVR